MVEGIVRRFPKPSQAEVMRFLREGLLKVSAAAWGGHAFLAERDFESSRGLQSTVWGTKRVIRRGATVERKLRWKSLSSVAPRRDALV